MGRFLALLAVSLICCTSVRERGQSESKEADSFLRAPSDLDDDLTRITIVIQNRTQERISLAYGSGGVVLGKSWLREGKQSSVVWPTHSFEGWTTLEPGESFWNHGALLTPGYIVALSVMVPADLVPDQIISSNPICVTGDIHLDIVSDPAGMTLVASAK